MSNIKDARKAAGITRRELSDRLKIPYNTLMNWENGLRGCPDYFETYIIGELKKIEKNVVLIDSNELKRQIKSLEVRVTGLNYDDKTKVYIKEYKESILRIIDEQMIFE